MATFWRSSSVWGLLAIFLSACGAGDDGPPATAYKSFVYATGPGTTDVDGPVPGSGRIFAFEIDDSSGRLTVIPGSPFVGAFTPSSITAHPAGRFVYVTDLEGFHGNCIRASAVDPATGALTEAEGGSGFVPWPNSAAVDPSGQFIYVGAGTGSIYAFTFNATTGAMAGVAGSPFGAGGNRSLAMDPSGRFLYALTGYPETRIGAFAVNPATGRLTEVAGSPFAAAAVRGLAPHPAGKFLYGAETSSGKISLMRIDPASGAPTGASGSPLVLRHPPRQIAIAPSGRLAYELNEGADGISVFWIDAASGTFRETPGSPFAAGSRARDMALSPSGEFVLVLTGAGISVWKASPSVGALTEVAGSPFAAGTSPHQIVVIRVAQ